MTIEIFNMTQGEPEWFQCRLGLPTASRFSDVMAKGAGKTRRSYMLKLAAEILTGQPREEFPTPAMERGRAMEAEARDLYAFTRDIEIEQVGFIRNGQKGASPDGLIGTDGEVEIKTKRGDLLVELLLDGSFPNEHFWQCQGSLWVCEREWIDLVCFWPGLPLHVKRLYRDDGAIHELSTAIDRFNTELAEIVERVGRYGQPPREVLREQLRASL